MDPNQNSNPPTGGQPMGGGMPTQTPQPGGNQPVNPTPVSVPEPLNPVPGAPVPGQGDSGQPVQGEVPQAPSGQGSDTPPAASEGDEGTDQGSEPSSQAGEGSEPPKVLSAVEGLHDTIIIGSGPAGLTAAIYTTRAALSTLILAGSNWGGQLMLTTQVDNFPGFLQGIQGPDLMMNMRKQAERFGAVFVQSDVDSVDFKASPFKIVSEGKTYTARSVIIATGAEARWLGLESEKQYIGRGVSSCAPCDAPFFKNKNVIVVGGGDAAMEEALVLTKFATSVIIVHRRDQFRASKIMQDKVLSNPKVKVIWNSEVTEVLGDGTKVTGVKMKNMQDQKEQELALDGIFVAIGHTPSTKLFTGQLELDEKGYAKIIHNSKFAIQNESGKEIGNAFSTTSSVEGIFIAGDVHDFHYRQAITAAGLGCQAAMDTERWLETQKP